VGQGEKGLQKRRGGGGGQALGGFWATGGKVGGSRTSKGNETNKSVQGREGFLMQASNPANPIWEIGDAKGHQESEQQHGGGKKILGTSRRCKKRVGECRGMRSSNTAVKNVRAEDNFSQGSPAQREDTKKQKGNASRTGCIPHTRHWARKRFLKPGLGKK